MARREPRGARPSTWPAKSQRSATPSAAARAATEACSGPDPEEEQRRVEPAAHEESEGLDGDALALAAVEGADVDEPERRSRLERALPRRHPAARPSGTTTIRSASTPAAISVASTAFETARKRSAARYFARERGWLEGRKSTRRWTTSGRPADARLHTAAPWPRESPA